jgi:hypothetical protein
MDYTYIEAIQETFNTTMSYLSKVWRHIKRTLHTIRRAGTRLERREAWKFLHMSTSHQRKRRSPKRARIYQRKAFNSWASEHWS